MRWKLEEILKREERKENKVGLRYRRIRINEHWWKWGKEEEILKEGIERKAKQEGNGCEVKENGGREGKSKKRMEVIGK